jgi:DNA-binding NarL/FixJ family response regulator
VQAVIIEPQALFIPFLAQALRRRGVAVLGSSRSSHPTALLKQQPDVVLIDVDHVAAPLGCLRELRAALPKARIVAVAQYPEPAWIALARAAGADAVLGAAADEDVLGGAILAHAA